MCSITYFETEMYTYPAKIAARSEMNHSGLLKPRIQTEWCLSKPNLMKALAQVRTKS